MIIGNDGYLKVQRSYNTLTRGDKNSAVTNRKVKKIEDKYNDIITKMILSGNGKFIRLNELMKFVKFDLVKEVCGKSTGFRIQTNDPQKFILFWDGVFYVMYGTFERYKNSKECRFMKDKEHSIIDTGYLKYVPIILDEKTLQVSKVIGVMCVRFHAKDYKEPSIFED